MTGDLSADARALLERAHGLEHAVDLYLAPGAVRLVADRLVEIMHRAPADALGERALWNTLFAAGELSLQVDVYRAHDLFRGAVALVSRMGASPMAPGDPRASALEMTFDFFFARPAHPLLPLRAREVVSGLASLFDGGRVATRAALHGLGHVVALAHDSGRRALLDEACAVIDDFTAGRGGAPPGAALLDLAETARAGALP